MVDICSALIDVANCTLGGKRTFTSHLCMVTIYPGGKQVLSGKSKTSCDLLNPFIVNAHLSNYKTFFEATNHYNRLNSKSE